ncbi:regulatory protein, luxR family [Chryseobacterium oleae]|uniref:Regulatory protein, luxR family n=1 Tax=Chryseobacterium oleae TaxID=491207 RepID=A0A1I4YHS8_CHROL|nr:LuxR C-terminal-related transcriptional regulator [Chryseobacterium oleae]SFN37588.1 regulatory protein, luxR family [Chryseobacterium oleae]
MAKKILSCLFFFSVYCYSLAQKVTEERLKSIIFDIQFSTAGDLEIKKIDSIISICHQENYRDCEAFGYLKIANIYNKNNDIKKAFHYTDLIEKKNLITSETDFEAVFYFYTIRSVLHQKLGERVAALKLLDDIAVQVKENPYYEYLLDWQYAGIYVEMKEDKKALKAYKNAYLKAKEYRKQPGQNTAENKNKISNSYKPAAYLAGAYQKLGKMDSAKIYIEEALQDAHSMDEIGLQYVASIYAAEYYLEAKDFENAQKNLWICKKIAVHHYKSENYHEGVIKNLINLYEKMGQKDSADYYSRQLLTIQNQNDAQNKIQKDILDKKKLAEDGSNTLERKTLIFLCIGLSICVAFIFLYFFYTKKERQKDFIPIETSDVQNNNLFEQVIMLAKENNSEFLTRFNDYCPGFSEKLGEAGLKSSEIRFCAYLYLNFSTKDIAEYTYTSVRTVQTKKYRLRKKLNIPNDTEIYLWFRNLVK